jgi:hypothetical protein
MRIASLRSLALTAILTAGTVVACSESTSPLAGTGQSMSLSFAGVRPPGFSGVQSVQNVLADTLVQVVGTDTLKITDVAIVLRRISLKRIEDSAVDCDTMPETAERSCEHFTVRDVLAHLPLTQGVLTSFSIPVDSGTFRSVSFKIHKPGNDAVDAAFKLANPGFDTVSVRVTGLWNGVPFTFVSRLDAKQEYRFDPPLVVDASGTATNLTIRMDITKWFVNGGSGALVDPSSANPGGANENLIKDNIRNSIKAFRDRDRDDDERNG